MSSIGDAGSPIEFLKRFKMQKKVGQKQFDGPQAAVAPDETVTDCEQKTMIADQTIDNEEIDNTFR